MTRNREEEIAKTKISLQPEPEDWCFECKDGGELVLCDERNCVKVYHPECVEKDESFFDNVESWSCDRHLCSNCKKHSKFCCIGCPKAVCKKCFSASEFTLVRGVKVLCVECLEIVKIIEQNLEHDSEGNKISLDDNETYETLFKEYWQNIKVKEGLTSDDISAALPKPNHRKGKNSVLHTSCSKSEDDSKSTSKEDYRDKQRPTKRKRHNSMEFAGWGSKPLLRFLASIGECGMQPLTRWRVRSIIRDYIKKKNLDLPENKRKFRPDENLFPIFKKKVMSKDKISDRLESHFAKGGFHDTTGDKSYDQNKNDSTDKHIDDQTCMKSKLSGLMEKPLMKKGDLLIKPSCFASINVSNIKLIYLKQSLVLELLKKQPESFVSMVVGTFVRAKVDSNDHKQRKSYQLVRVLGVVNDEISHEILLQVSSTPKAIPISELSDVDFKEVNVNALQQECEDLRQKVKTSLLPKLTVGEVQEKAASLHEDITKHWIATRRVYLQYLIDRANLRGRTKEKIARLEEKEELEKPERVEEMLSRLPSVSPEFMEAKYDESDEDKTETSNRQDHP